ISAAETPEEVAGVVAHEIAHVTEQHSMRQIISSTGLFLIIQAFLGDASGLLGALADNSYFLLNQKFSRDHEREADEKGMELLIAANIDPQGMISFFETLEEEHADMPSALNMISTHPATKERIKDSTRMLED